MRYEDWQTKFWVAMEEARTAHFEWGSHDCVLFAAKMADAISDSGYVGKARAAFTWTDMRSAIQLLGDGLQPQVESVLGEMQRWQRLSQGDIVLIADDDGRESLAIHDGCQLLGPDEIGYKVIPFRCAKGGWKVD
jgi:hypothetical protein